MTTGHCTAFGKALRRPRWRSALLVSFLGCTACEQDADPGTEALGVAMPNTGSPNTGTPNTGTPSTPTAAPSPGGDGMSGAVGMPAMPAPMTPEPQMSAPLPPATLPAVTASPEPATTSPEPGATAAPMAPSASVTQEPPPAPSMQVPPSEPSAAPTATAAPSATVAPPAPTVPVITPPPAEPPPAEPVLPNIVVILADDMGIGDIGAYNADSKVPTPALNAMAAAGMRFNDAHSPSAVCTPTRYSLLTGRYAWRSRLKSGVLNGESRALIETGRETIASMLKKKGYATSMIGKWHLGLGNGEPTNYSQALVPGPNAVGFDYWYGIPASLDHVPYVWVENERVVAEPTQQIDASRHRRVGGNGFFRGGDIAPGFVHQDVLPDITTRAAEQVAELSQGDAPFFLYVPFTAPHTPWLPSPEFFGVSTAGYYGDFAAQVDASVGVIAEALDNAGVADNTLFIFTSDNGSHWLVDDVERFDHRANGNHRGQKADIHEGGHRVPFIVSWPGRIPANTETDELVLLTDLMATFAAATDAEHEGGEDSHNFLPTLVDSQAAPTVRESAILHSLNGTFAVREGNWKLIEGLGSGGFTQPRIVNPAPGGPRGELYDLDADPLETTNLYLDQPEVVARLQAVLNQIRGNDSSPR